MHGFTAPVSFLLLLFPGTKHCDLTVFQAASIAFSCLSGHLTVLVRMGGAWAFLRLIHSESLLPMFYAFPKLVSAEVSTSTAQAISSPQRAFSYHFTRISHNRKTGPMPVTTTSANTCPASCSFRGNGCYAESGPLALHWKAVTAGRRGGTFDELLEGIRSLPRDALWRHNQAGDLTPIAPGVIDAQLLLRLAMANRGRRGFTYTHYAMTPENAAAVQHANTLGLTINLSAETLEQADEHAALGVAPVVVVLPAKAMRAIKTPAGRHVIVCPASTDNSDCLNCGICQQRHRQAIVGFPAHGSARAKVQAVFWQE